MGRMEREELMEEESILLSMGHFSPGHTINFKSNSEEVRVETAGLGALANQVSMGFKDVLERMVCLGSLAKRAKMVTSLVATIRTPEMPEIQGRAGEDGMPGVPGQK